MKLLYRSSPTGQRGQSKGKLTQVGAVASFLILSLAALSTIAPASLLLLQLFLGFCQTCITILRARGI